MKATIYSRNGYYLFVIYGSANINFDKGCLSWVVPLQAMHMIVKDYFACNMVDEFYTSQMCGNCKSWLKICMNTQMLIVVFDEDSR